MTKNPIIIVGTGLAGYNAAREIRKHDTVTPLILITEDDGAYYSKPSLSTAMSQGKSAQDLIVHTADQMASQLNAQIITQSRVLGLIPPAKRLDTTQGPLHYSACVLACGATPTELDIPTPPHSIVHVNSRKDYATLCDHIQGKERVAILGSGLIGSEFANDLSKQNFSVDFISRSAMPLNHLLPAQAAQAVRDSLIQQGVRYHGGTTTRSIEAKHSAYQLTLSLGQVIEVDLILSAIGLGPNIQLAKAAGLKTNRGICVDRTLVSSDPHIYSLGDCAEIEGTLLQFVMPLMHQSRALGATLAGTPTRLTYPCMPVSVKTACAVTTVPPHEPGTWQIEGSSPDFKGLCTSADGRLVGWALTGACTSHRRELTSLVSPLFGAVETP